MPAPSSLIDKINALPSERIAEVEDFVDFLSLKDQDRALVRSARVGGAAVFAAVWENSEDDVYNAL
jgi:hypothetical protein